MTSEPVALVSDPPISEALTAALLARGVCRALEQLGYASLLEFPLANGRRADILALGRGGDLVIIEIKSSIADFRADRKWVQYRDFADRFYFAVPKTFPAALIPEDCGLIVADAFAASLIRDGSPNALAPSRRRAVTLRFALAAAARLRRHLDPQAGLADF
ncbi:MAG TPA: MmcB family DNA repair protein [Stellaceae bacterium]|jgi:hypothetical protein|nr:MmcB family DNA repair protein [Stellaceae bacterium]